MHVEMRSQKNEIQGLSARKDLGSNKDSDSLIRLNDISKDNGKSQLPISVYLLRKRAKTRNKKRHGITWVDSPSPEL